MAVEKSESKGHNFGTFEGVFTPSILTIFGLIMFMRTSYVVGHAGIYFALGILALAKVITFATGLSISAVSTNTPVKGGGAYFLISRALGPGFGAAVGIALFAAQALSVPFYIFGFSEAIIKNYQLAPDLYLWVALGTGAVLFIMTWIGAGWVVKCQYFILAILGLAITAFLGGAITHFDLETFSANALPYDGGEGVKLSMTTLFAIFFPAVTGIMAGVNMSGDLKEPARAIPRGSIWAIGLSFVVYGIQIMLTGGAFPRAELIQNPYMVLVTNALFGASFLVSFGVYAATLSSALGSFLGSPRVLQALAVDKILTWVNPFGKGVGPTNEPKRALLLTAVISFVILVIGGLSGLGEGGFLNAIAEVVTMFFLYTYGIVNLAAFVESYGANPSFRPRFKYYHWSTALIGAIGCFAVSFMINAAASAVALLIISVLYFLASRQDMACAFGDARRGFVFSRIRKNLLLLRKMPSDPKNWRPRILVLARDATRNCPLLEFGCKFECNRGILSVVTFLTGELDDVNKARKKELKRLHTFGEENGLELFPEVIATSDFDIGLNTFLQGHSIGPVKPNIVMSGWPNEAERIAPFMKHIRSVLRLKMSSVILVNSEGVIYPNRINGHIDIWWRGHSNGSLMLILAYLLCRNPHWQKVKIRILRITAAEADRETACAEMQELVDAARIEAEIKIIVSTKPFNDVLKEESGDASALFMGFLPPDDAHAEESFQAINERQVGMPPTFYVSSNGDADLLA